MKELTDFEFEGLQGKESGGWLEEGYLCVPYIPDFRTEDMVFYFSPRRAEAEAVYHSLPPRLVDRWSPYFTKKGWQFIHDEPGEREAEGPFKVRPGKLEIVILDAGKIFSPKPQFRLKREGEGLPIASMEKKRPFDPWKPTYIRALNFIKKYEFPKPVPRIVEYCIQEIEECGEVAGSVSWENAERILFRYVQKEADVREVLMDIFEKRPEDFPLGSEVYLRVLGASGEEGFKMVCGLHRHPQRLKRCHVARTLGKLGKPESLPMLIHLLDDEDPEVRQHALRGIGKLGIRSDDAAVGRIRAFLESAEVAERVWAGEAFLRGGDVSQEKFLLQLVKECPLPLHDMGELGDILIDLKLVQATPYLINRLKSNRPEISDDAAEALRGLTGLGLEYHVHGDETLKRNAIREWSRWWEDYKKNRRTG